jgi:hypothetical protein
VTGDNDFGRLAGEALAAAARSPDYDGDWLFAAIRDGDSSGLAVRGYPGDGQDLASTLAGHIAACLNPAAWAPADIDFAGGPPGTEVTPPDRVTRVADAGRAAIAGRIGPGTRLIISVRGSGGRGKPARSGFYQHGYGTDNDPESNAALAADLARYVNDLMGLPVGLALSPESIAATYSPARSTR